MGIDILFPEAEGSPDTATLRYRPPRRDRNGMLSGLRQDKNRCRTG